MAESIVEFFRNIIGNDYITVLIVSMIPFVEVRGSIPIAIAMGMNVFVSIGLAFLGSIIIAPIILLVLKPILNWLKKFKIFNSFIVALEEGFQGKADKVMEGVENQAYSQKRILRKKMLGTYLFVAFPVPMTGVWTGSAVACFLDIPFWWACLVIGLGNLTASIIMSILSYFFAAYIDIILGVIIGIVLIAVIAFIVKIAIKMSKKKKEGNDDAKGNSN